MTKPDLAALFQHVDAVLPLVARAAGELGTAGSNAFRDTGISPFAFIGTIKRFFGQRRAKQALQQATPHLQAIARLSAESRQWLAMVPEPDPYATAALDALVGEGILDVIIDGIIHDRIETQVLELNHVLDELGRLHRALRTHGFHTAAAS